MFSLKPFISLVIAAAFAVAFLQVSVVSVASANEPAVQIAASQPININTADATAIAAKLKGIGIKKAQAIVSYRETYGAFHDVDELVEVKGIGASILEKNRALILVE